MEKTAQQPSSKASSQDLPLVHKPSFSSHRSVKKSLAIESLINQNDELSSRLKVSLRKIVQLENELENENEIKSQFKFYYDSLKEKALVLDKKCSRLKQRQTSVQEILIQKEELISQLKERITALNLEYLKIYKQQQTLEKQLKRLVKYQKNISIVAKDLREKYNQSCKKFEYKDKLNTDLKKKVEESTLYIQGLNKVHLEKQTLLTTEFGTQSSQMNTKIELLSKENSELKEANKNNIELHNKVVATNRKYDELSEAYHTKVSGAEESIDRLKKMLHQYELQLKDNTEEWMHKEQTSSETNKKLTLMLQQTLKDNKRLKGQVEHLHELWNEVNSEQEKLKSKNSSLQKLNQSLSLALNKYRCQIQELKNQSSSKLVQPSRKKPVTTQEDAQKDKSIQRIQFLIDEIEAESNV